MPEPEICGVNLGVLLIRMEEFDGFRSPGILLGGMMIEGALNELGTTPYLNAVTETVVCLPDAVQLLTPCTIGKEKPPFEELAAEILATGADLIVHRPVRLHHALKRSEPVPTGQCPQYGESYPLHLGPACPSCRGEAYYVYQKPR